MAPLKAAELNPPLNVTLIRDLAGLELLKDFFQRCKLLGWDIETTPLKDFFWRRIRTIQFGNQQEQYVIDLKAFCDSGYLSDTLADKDDDDLAVGRRAARVLRPTGAIRDKLPQLEELLQ